MIAFAEIVCLPAFAGAGLGSDGIRDRASVPAVDDELDVVVGPEALLAVARSAAASSASMSSNSSSSTFVLNFFSFGILHAVDNGVARSQKGGK
jgi:hypothetical protein